MSACGATSVETRARDQALERLGDNLSATLACVESVAADLDVEQGVAALQTALAPCGDVSILNARDGTIRSRPDDLPAGAETLFVTAAASVDGLRLDAIAQGTGLAEAGVANARVQLIACWTVTLERAQAGLSDIVDATCNQPAVERLLPTEIVLVAELDMPMVRESPEP